MPGHVTFRAAERISLEGNHFTHLGGLALVLSRAGSNNTVRDNVVDDVSGRGVEVRGPAPTFIGRENGLSAPTQDGSAATCSDWNGRASAPPAGVHAFEQRTPPACNPARASARSYGAAGA